MSNTLKTTAGPWKVGLNGDGNLAIFTEHTQLLSLVAGFKSGTVKEADARLMAAAPELRERLNELLADINQWARDFGYADHGARNRAQALLLRLDAE